MEFRDRIYEVMVSGKVYGFFLEWKENGAILLAIPDAGGQADMSPKYPEQLDWLLPKLEGIKGLKRIWTTVWEIRTESALREVEQLFEKEGRVSARPRSSFY